MISSIVVRSLYPRMTTESNGFEVPREGVPPYTIRRLVVIAPNWLGDAVMALPAIADVKRALPDATVAVAARAAVAPLFEMVDDVDVLDARRSLRRQRFDAALLLPNSFRAALVACGAGIPERWGYRTGGRGLLLTRAVHRAGPGASARQRRWEVEAEPPLHQAAYYQRLVRELGFGNGPPEPHLSVPPRVTTAADALLLQNGWNGHAPLAAIAPGAAYGGAKRWPPDRFASLVHALACDGVQTVIVGTQADRRTADEVIRDFHAISGTPERTIPAPLNLVGLTDLLTLAGVLAASRALVTNDSGAMHLAAAIGIPVTAVFGPTDERATRPLGSAHAVVTHETWCRPCMLRECPLNHECMRGIEVSQVLTAARQHL
jgi:heptosyltransferase-2